MVGCLPRNKQTHTPITQSNEQSQNQTNNTNKQTTHTYTHKQTHTHTHKQTEQQTNKHNMPLSPKNWQGLLPSAGCLSMCPQRIKGGCFPSRGTSLDEDTCVIGSVLIVCMYVIKTNYWQDNNQPLQAHPLHMLHPAPELPCSWIRLCVIAMPNEPGA